MNIRLIQVISCTLLTNLLLFFIPHALVAQTVPINSVTEQVSKQRGLQLPLLLQNRGPAQQIRKHNFSHEDLRGFQLLRPNLVERLAGLSFNEAYNNPDYQNVKHLFSAHQKKSTWRVVVGTKSISMVLTWQKLTSAPPASVVQILVKPY